MRYHRTHPYMNRECCPTFLGEYFPIDPHPTAARFRTETPADRPPVWKNNRALSHAVLSATDAFSQLERTFDLLSTCFWNFQSSPIEEKQEQVPLLFTLCETEIRRLLEEMEVSLTQARKGLEHPL